MPSEPGAARLARSAREVDLADDPPPTPFLHVRPAPRDLLDDADEFVAGNAPEVHVATGQLDIGPADSRERHAHESLSLGGNRIVPLNDGDPLIDQHGFHAKSPDRY